MKILWTAMAWAFGTGLYAQPGDRHLELVLFDDGAAVGCSATAAAFELYSAHAPYAYIAGDETPRMRKSEIVYNGPFACLENSSPEPVLRLPNDFYFSFPSSLSTSLIVVVRSKRDTMFVENNHTYVYAKAVYPSGSSVSVPFVLPFESGWYKMSELMADARRLALHDAYYADFIRRTAHLYPVAKPNEPTLPVSQPDRAYEQPAGTYTQNDTSVFASMEKKAYRVQDTIRVKISGTVMLTGECSNNRIVWTLQKQAGGQWETVADMCCAQMDCGLPFAKMTDRYFHVLIPDGATADEMPSNGHLTGGVYRLAVYNASLKPKWTEPFIVDAE